MEMSNELDRLLFFEQARKISEATYAANPLDADTSFAFLTNKEEDAKPYFEKAAQYFQQAVDEEPTNEVYLKSLEISSKAPELHQEIIKHGLNQQTLGAGPSTSTTSSTSTKTATKNKKSSDLKYDIFGWIILAVGIVAWVGFAKSHMPPAPPPPPR
ncbi:Plant specific mitochondrial import receptor subunit TOM20 [Corchorus olitorius]|uniref:Plant specific mitochondrial import receptor subunit TOM20 n=1 Tax=Corchorus olitorius TaxID=93759 RepID=A0A1R3JX88_9ROSI|nr:Plant specific mitochondrial import receptor subunit TOM20 [Corchorus olitorius]